MRCKLLRNCLREMTIIAFRPPNFLGPGGTKLCASLLLSLLFVPFAAAAGDTSLAGNHVEQVVARVNGDVVTLDELRRVQVDLLEVSRQHRREADDHVPDPIVLGRVALQELIQRRLLLQEAARRQMSVNRDELDQAIAELRRRFADLASFGAWMDERGLGDLSLHDTVREDILVERVTTALVADAEVSEQQISDYYEAHKDDLVIGQQVRLRIIAVETLDAAEDILTALRTGRNFSSLARERSQGSLAAQGGDTGWLDLESLPQPLREVVNGLRQGEASWPVQKNTDEFLIVALQGRQPVRAESLQEARAEIERRLLNVEKQKTVAAWFAAQQQQSEIEILLQPEEIAQGTI